MVATPLWLHAVSVTCDFLADCRYSDDWQPGTWDAGTAQ